jgi:hypothetical protein
MHEEQANELDWRQRQRHRRHERRQTGQRNSGTLDTPRTMRSNTFRSMHPCLCVCRVVPHARRMAATAVWQEKPTERKRSASDRPQVQHFCQNATIRNKQIGIYHTKRFLAFECSYLHPSWRRSRTKFELVFLHHQMRFMRKSCTTIISALLATGYAHQQSIMSIAGFSIWLRSFAISPPKCGTVSCSHSSAGGHPVHRPAAERRRGERRREEAAVLTSVRCCVCSASACRIAALHTPSRSLGVSVPFRVLSSSSSLLC